MVTYWALMVKEPKYNNCLDINVHHDPKLLTVEK